MLLGMDDKWRQAEEPLHWLVDSPDPVHSGTPAASRALGRRTQDANERIRPGLAVRRVAGRGDRGSDRPDRLRPWRNQHGTVETRRRKTRGVTAFMVRCSGRSGSPEERSEGVLWYQGESDAMGGGPKVYPKVFSDFIAAVRSDFGQPELPFYYVQIGRFVNGSIPKAGTPCKTPSGVLVDHVPTQPSFP